MLYFTDSGLKRLHDAIVDAYGGESGVLQRGLLESAALRPHTTVAGYEQYVGIIRKASALGYAITIWHPFVDGNKRTALMSMSLFLYLNDIWMADAMDSVKYMVLLASDKLSEQQFTEVLARWCSKSAIGENLKSFRFEWWPNFQMRLFRAMGYRLGYGSFRRRQLDWLAAGDVATLERILREHADFRKAGYPKPFNLKFADEDFIEE